MLPISVLDLAPVPEGSDVRRSLANTLDLAVRAEGWGYCRYWVAEHHNMEGIASAATAVVIGAIAGATRSIRVGAGGIMLPNHAPLMVAEAFGTLAALHGDRIDLGLGRAPGTDAATARALRRYTASADRFPDDVLELLGYLEPAAPGQAVRAVPGEGTRVPVWILGSSLFGAQLAAALGLPFAFASHFAPAALGDALAIYRETFRPSQFADRPRVMIAANVFAAETDAEGARLRTSMQQAFANLRSGRPGKLPRPVDDIATRLDRATRVGVDAALAVSATGARETVRDQLAEIVGRWRPDELMLTGHIHDHAARLRSFEIAAEAMGVGRPAAAPRAVAFH
jgi:luciferase family oxidoreductase group 1